MLNDTASKNASKDILAGIFTTLKSRQIFVERAKKNLVYYWISGSYIKLFPETVCIHGLKEMNFRGFFYRFLCMPFSKMK